MCADTTTSPMRRTQDSVTHVPGLYPTYSLPSTPFVIPAKARIHALSPTRKDVNRERPGTTNAVNVARGLVPRYGLPPAGNRSDEPSGPKRTPTIPVEAGFKPA